MSAGGEAGVRAARLVAGRKTRGSLVAWRLGSVSHVLRFSTRVVSHDMETATDIRSALMDNRQQAEQNTERRAALIVAAVEAGIPKTELADLAGVHRSTVYEILDRHAKKVLRRENGIDAGEIEHLVGRVVEDRWGLRWRADLRERREPAWQCRSVGLRVWRKGGQLTERGPLRHVRDDPIFTLDPELQAKRAADQADDAAVTHDGSEDAD